MRKKVLPILIALLALCGSTFATDYNLWVAGTRVTSSNSSQITSSNISGYVSYNSSTNTLTLNSATIQVPYGSPGIRSDIPNLHINLVGMSTISGLSYGIWAEQNLSIGGNGRLDISSSTFDAIKADASLEIYQSTINAEGRSDLADGIEAGSLHIYSGAVVRAKATNNSTGYGLKVNGNFTINSSTLTAETTSASAYGIFASGYCYIQDHSTATVTSSGCGIMALGACDIQSGSIVRVQTSGMDAYAIRTSDNLTIQGGSNVTAISTGYRSYGIYVSGNCLIQGQSTAIVTSSGGEELGIMTLGSCDIQSGSVVRVQTSETSAKAILTHGNFTIQGNSVVSAISTGFASYGIDTWDDIAVKDNSNLTAEGERYGIVGTSGTTFRIESSKVSAKNHVSFSCIQGYDDLELSGACVIEPDVAIYNTSTHRMENSFYEPINDLTIGQCLWVFGVKLQGNSGTYTFTGNNIWGSVKYDFATNTLTLDNATITDMGYENYFHGIKNHIPGLNIVLVGNNLITTGGDGIFSDGNLNIRGSGKLRSIGGLRGITVQGNLNVESAQVVAETKTTNSVYAIFADGNVNLSNHCIVSADSHEYGIKGTSTHTLTVNNSSLSASNTVSGNSAISGFSHLTTAGGVAFIRPVNAHYDESNRVVKDSNGNLADEVVLDVPPRNLSVAGHSMPSGSGSYSFTGSGIISGTVSFNYATNTLTLNNATISASNGFCIDAEMLGLKIELVGSNSIVGASGGIRSYLDGVSFQGSGSLNINVSGTYGIISNMNINFNQCKVNVKTTGSKGISTPYLTVGNGAELVAEGSDFGLFGTGGTLNVSNGSVNAKNSNANYSAIEGFSGLSGSITWPVGGVYDVTEHRVETSTGSAAHDINIETVNHSLWVAGHKLQGNSGSYSFTGSGISGNVTYNFATQRLVLSNASINANNDDGIVIGIPGVKVEIIGNNSISGTHNGIVSYVGTEFYDEGRLNINVTGEAGINVTGNLRIDGCELTIASTTYGIKGYPGYALTVNGRTLNVTNSSSSSKSVIEGFGNLILIGDANITYPFDAYYSGGMQVSGGIIHEVIIETVNHSLWVAGHKLQGNSGTYSFSGSGIAGSVTYNYSTNTLTLTNATISVNSYYGIKSALPNLNIKLEGSNSITGTMAGIYSYCNINMSGTGSLFANVQSNNAAIYVNGYFDANGITLTAKNTQSSGNAIYVACNMTVGGQANVTAEGVNYGISGSSGITLTVSHATLTAKNSSNSSASAIRGFSHLNMSGVSIATPAGGYYDENQQRLETSSGGIAHQAVIKYAEYQLWVNNIQVNSENSSNILGDGTVSYNASSQTLTLNNANINSHQCPGIKSSISGLKINLTGNNSINCNATEGMLLEEATTFTGTGKLIVEGKTNGITVTNNLTLQGGCEIHARGNGSANRAAVCCEGSGSYTLTVNASTLSANCRFTNVGTIYGFTSLSLVGSSIFTPAGATWNSTERCLMKNGQRVKSDVLIDHREYNLYVQGIRVNSGNAADILGDGKVSYNETANILTLNNASITNTGGGHDGIQTSIDNLTINLTGSNTITSGDDGIQITSANTTFSGFGTLTVNAPYGIWSGTSSGKTISFTNGCKVVLNGNTAGLSFASGTLNVNCATLWAQGGSKCIVCSNLTMTGVEISAPSGATFSNGNIVYAGTTNAVNGEYVKITPLPYDLWVKGIQVTSANASNVLGDGKVSYDANNNVLTLNGATIQGNTNRGINNNIPNLTIKLIGYNTITSNNSGLFSNADFTIEGRGRLTVNGSDGIYAYRCNLTIQDGCTINAIGTSEGNHSGIYGSSSQTLTFSNCSVNVANGNGNVGSVYGFTNLHLNNVYIATIGVVWNSAHRRVEDANGNAVITAVSFAPTKYDLQIGGTDVTAANATDFYDDGGSVSYDALNNVLTLNDAEIQCNQIGIENNISNLKINLLGTNVIHSSLLQGILSKKDFTIEGTGYLEASGTIGIQAQNANLTIQGGCTINASPTSSGYTGIAGYSIRTLTIDRSSVTTSSANSGYSPIYGFGQLVLNHVAILEPSNVSYNTTSHKLTYANGNVVTGEVVIDGLPYDLYVIGKQVNSANCVNIIHPHIEGTVSYDPDENVLTLDNAILSYDEQGVSVIENHIPNLTIQLIGENHIIGNEGESCYGIMNDVNADSYLYVKGPGELYSGASVLFYGRTCTFSIADNAIVQFYDDGDDGGYLDGTYSPFKLEVSQSELKAHYIYGLYDASGFGSPIVAPNGARVVFEPGEFSSYEDVYYVGFENNGPVAEEVVVTDWYDLEVAGVRVTASNAHNITGEGISGFVSYEPTSQTLTLDNATITNGGIYSYLEDDATLTLSLIGHNTINATSTGIFLQNSAIIKAGSDSGDDWLNVNTTGACGIYIEMGDFITIQGGCHVDAAGSNCGISGEQQTLTISDSWVRSQSGAESSSSAISNLELALDGVGIVQPLGAYYDNYEIYDAFHEEAKMVEIGYTEYELYVADTQVTSANAHDILGDGKVSYNANTSTLTLNNANIVNTSDDGIATYINGLTIELIGTNTISSTDDGISINNVDTYITGSGTLTINAPYGIYENTDDYESTLTLSDDCNVAINHTLVGIRLWNMALRIDNATLQVNGTGGIGIHAHNGIQLVNVEIITPEGAYWNGTEIVDADGNTITTGIVIEPYNIFGGSISNDWSLAGNWSRGALPGTNSHVIIASDCNVNGNVQVGIVDIDEGVQLTVASGTLTAQQVNSQATTGLLLAEGAQLVSPDTDVLATTETSVAAWGENTGWRLLASPFANTNLGTSTTLTSDGASSYDLYRYEESNQNEQEWVNQKGADGFSTLDAGLGYLYANASATTHTLSGTLNGGSVSVNLTYTTPDSDYPLAGFNLIGNPYPHNIYKGVGCAIDNSSLAAGYYTLGSNGQWTAHTDADAIAPCQAILVRTAAATTLTMSNTAAAPSAKGAQHSLRLSVEGNGLSDQVVIMEGEGQNLDKVAHLNAETPMLYVIEADQMSAIAYTQGSKAMQLGFKAGATGTYTLSLSESDLGKVILYDTLTGISIELKPGESYTFMASPSDSAERFTVTMK